MNDWRRLRVAPDRTHHLCDGTPAYEHRFREVLSFHEPGLAAVSSGACGTHIGPDGIPAYRSQFRRTFGFYTGLAAVESTKGWMHIRPNGSPAYEERFTWCGNFQEERCVVRAVDDGMFHLTLTGSPAYPHRWRYAGDFREGAAAVICENGDATHILPDGRILHGRWFRDLDAFHKGYARARDERGWHHVDRLGNAVYTERFDEIENFYNGLALVRSQGERLLIDEGGKWVQRLSNSAGSIT